MMGRTWQPKVFDSLYEEFICHEGLQFGGAEYYRRYRSRYKDLLRRFARLAPAQPVEILDIGGGQLGLMALKMWGDRAVTSDLPGPHLDYVASHGVRPFQWDLCSAGEPPFDSKFDFVFFSEVIEHIPIPGHIVLERIRKVLRPDGFIICTTPNLYRLRNVVFMITGKQIFEHFRYSDDGTDVGHTLEYSREHLLWQFDRAGFTNCQVEFVQMHHLPTNPLYRPLAILGYPLHMIPRWRDYLVATAQA